MKTEETQREVAVWRVSASSDCGYWLSVQDGLRFCTDADIPDIEVVASSERVGDTVPLAIAMRQSIS